MKLLYDSGVLGHGNEPTQPNDKLQVKQYEINGQLFRIEVQSGGRANYRIYRFSESGEWQWMEAEGDSFRGKPKIQYVTYHNTSTGKDSPATWALWWVNLLKQAVIYSQITPAYKGAKK